MKQQVPAEILIPESVPQNQSRRISPTDRWQLAPPDMYVWVWLWKSVLGVSNAAGGEIRDFKAEDTL